MNFCTLTFTTKCMHSHAEGRDPFLREKQFGRGAVRYEQQFHIMLLSLSPIANGQAHSNHISMRDVLATRHTIDRHEPLRAQSRNSVSALKGTNACIRVHKQRLPRPRIHFYQKSSSVVVQIAADTSFTSCCSRSLSLLMAKHEAVAAA